MTQMIGQIVHSKHGPFALLILLFVCAEFYLASVHSFPTTRFETDGVDYMDRASGVLLTADPYHGPGYPLAIRLARGVTGSSPFAAAQLVSILAGLLLIVSAYRAFSLSDGPRTAFAAAVLTAFTPTVLQYGVMVLSDVLAAALLWTTIWILTRAEYPDLRRLFVAGLIAGLAYLTRYVFIFLVLVPPLLLLMTRRWSSRSLIALLGFYVGFFLVTIPWGVLLWLEKGNPLWNLNHLNVAFKMYRDGQGWNEFPTVEHFPSMGSVVRSNPALFFESWFQTLLDFPRAIMRLIPKVGTVLGTVGVLLWCAKFSTRKLTIAVTLAGYVLLVSLVWIDPRFLIPLAPFLALCVSRAIEIIPDRASLDLSQLRNGAHRSVPIRGPITVLILLGVLSASWHLPSWFREHEADEYIEAANWLIANHANRETTVMVAKPHIPFYSGTSPVRYREHGLQSTDARDLDAVLARIRPDYFIYDERYASVEFPQFRHLLETGRQTGALHPVFVVDSPMRLVVFRYVPGN